MMQESDLDQPIEILELSVATYNMLRNGGAQTINDLVRLTPIQLINNFQFRRKHLRNLVGALAELGLSLGMTVDSNGHLVHTIDQHDIESLIREKEATPADYVDWYRHSHGYAFPPQAQVEKLFGVLSRVLNERFAHDRQHVIEFEAKHSEGKSYEAWKDLCVLEGDVKDDEELLELADEMLVIGLCSVIERERIRVLSSTFQIAQPEKLCDLEYLSSEFPWVGSLFGGDAIREIMFINSCLRSTGRVSKDLSRCHPSWIESERITGLGEAYKRLAPSVGAYWVDFVRKCKEEGTQTNHSDTPSGESAQ
jgi:hypothetical protein